MNLFQQHNSVPRHEHSPRGGSGHSHDPHIRQLVWIIIVGIILVVAGALAYMTLQVKFGLKQDGSKNTEGLNGGTNTLGSNTAGPDGTGSDTLSGSERKPLSMTIEQAKGIVEKYGDKPQFVLLAFDGSRSLAMWRATRNFAKEMNEKNKPLHFTYFINAVYLLDPDFHDRFTSPGQKSGVSNIGFATGEQDVLDRVAEINAAYKEGHEIGSHNAGHFPGGNWTLEEWRSQFDLFDDIVGNTQKMRPEYKLEVPISEIVGFRAPDLSTNAYMYEVLKENNFLYDASKTASHHGFPYKDAYGLWQLPLPAISIGPANKKGYRSQILAMDYNLFIRHTKGIDKAKKGTILWNTIYGETMDAFNNYFESSYRGKRTPVYFASHFSLWNDGVYWQSMQDFAQSVCGKEQVYCITYKDLAIWMEAKSILETAPVPVIDKQI